MKFPRLMPDGFSFIFKTEVIKITTEQKKEYLLRKKKLRVITMKEELWGVVTLAGRTVFKSE